MEKALKLLYSNYLLNVDMIQCIKKQEYKIIKLNDKGVLISSKDNLIAMLCVIDINIAREFINEIPKEAKMIVAHQKFYISYLKEKFNVVDEMVCYQSVYMKDKSFIIENNEIEIMTLDETYSEYVYNKAVFKNYVDICIVLIFCSIIKLDTKGDAIMNPIETILNEIFNLGHRAESIIYHVLDERKSINGTITDVLMKLGKIDSLGSSAILIMMVKRCADFEIQ